LSLDNQLARRHSRTGRHAAAIHPPAVRARFAAIHPPRTVLELATYLSIYQLGRDDLARLFSLDLERRTS
jgi:hypothetical protein